MDHILIRGGNALNGDIQIGGAKNAALPLMAASLLTDDALTLSNLPHLADITTLANLLVQHGVDITMNGENGGHEGRTLSLSAGPTWTSLPWAARPKTPAFSQREIRGTPTMSPAAAVVARQQRSPHRWPRWRLGRTQAARFASPLLTAALSV